MLTWSKARFVLLALLLAVLSHIVYTRGLGWGLGGAPAALRGPYSSEEAWVVGEIARDVTEMASFPATAPPPSVQPVAGQSARYRVARADGAGAAVDVDLSQQLWSPESFVPLVAAVAGQTTTTAATTRPVVHTDLLELTPSALVAASASVSSDLARDMRNPATHDAAAMTIGAFALRESAGRFHDVRWSMNRMTAHLALAAAFRNGAPATMDGRIAEAILLTLANHQTRALALLDSLQKENASEPVGAWVRALKLRVTQDWRLSTSPGTASLVEKQEYFRARRATVARSLASHELEVLNVSPGVEWNRMVQASAMSIEDGGVVDDALALEQAESAAVFNAIHGRAIASESEEPLNVRAGRCLDGGKPNVLPWGAWAEFSQRHLAMLVWRIDSYYRRSIGDSSRADEERQILENELGDLSMFPLGTIFWTKGPRAVEADLQYINEAIDAAVSAPERVTSTVWSFLETSANYEAVRASMPSKRGWFFALAVRTPYDAGVRAQEMGLAAQPDLVDAIVREAPYDYTFGTELIRTRYGDKAPYADVLRVFSPRLEYDLRALRIARDRATDPEERLRVSRLSCAVASAECMALGAELARQNRADEAAREYARAFDDPSVDAVSISNNAGWLVNYYVDRKQTAAAEALADRASSTGAYEGVIIKAYLDERLQRFQVAEEEFTTAGNRYNRPAELIGFYYRAVNVHKQAAYKPRLDEHLARVFPNGLVSLSLGSTRPETGVMITRDSELSRSAGLQAGDLIVGLEGWRVENLSQYRAINAFFKTDAMKITAWRTTAFDASVTAPNRLMGIDFRSHPINGWAEE
jgi:hypothetical protein